MGTFVITKRFDDCYKFEYTSRKGKTIFTSNSFNLNFECEEGIYFLQNSIHDLLFNKCKSSCGKYFFKILSNDQEIGISRKFTTNLLLNKAIDEIKRQVHKSEIVDFSTQNFTFPEINTNKEPNENTV